MIEMWKASHQLQMEFLVSACEDFVLKNISLENWHIVYYNAKLLLSSKVTQFVIKYIVQNFLAVVSSTNFIKLQFEDLLKIIESNQLSVYADSIIQAILKWCREESVERKQKNEEGIYNVLHVGDLMQAVTMSKVSKKCLASLLTNKVIQENKEAIITKTEERTTWGLTVCKCPFYLGGESVTETITDHVVVARSILTRRDPLYSDSDSESYSDSDEEEYESAIMEADQDIRREIHQLFTEAFVWKWFCDFTVVVEGVEVKCHRFILNACSGFFEALFMCERREKRVTIQGISFEIFMLILNDIYSGFNILTVENMLDVWKASHQLMIDYLTTKCEYFIIENISEENVFPIYFVAKQLVSDNVKHCLSNYMTSNFSSIVLSDSLAQLEYEDFLNILENIEQEGNFNVQHIQAILKWSGAIEKKAHCNKKYSPNLKKLKSLILALDLSKASPECLAAIMTNEFIINDQELITEINKHVAKFLNQKAVLKTLQNKTLQVSTDLQISSILMWSGADEEQAQETNDNLQHLGKLISCVDLEYARVECFAHVTNRQRFCDVTVVVDDNEFPCHRFVLNACSGFFANKLKSYEGDGCEMKVHVSDVHPDIFILILDLLYCGSDILTERNMLQVWSASHDLDITFLKTMCEKFVLDSVNDKNVLNIYCKAKWFQSENVLQRTLRYIVTNFQYLFCSYNFFKIYFEDLVYILKEPQLPADEQSKVEAILNWCGTHDTATGTNFKHGDNLQHLGDLFELVGLSNISVDFLQYLMVNEMVQANKRTIAIVNTSSAQRLMALRSFALDRPGVPRNRNKTDLDVALLSKTERERKPVLKGSINADKVKVLQEVHSCFIRGSNRRSFCDLTVVVEDIEIRCHRFVLNACSGYFKSFFNADTVKTEKKGWRVTLTGMSSSVFTTVLDMIYDGSELLTKQNMLEILSASYILKIPFIMTYCTQFVFQNMNADNCYEVCVCSKLLNSKIIFGFVLRFMVTNFRILVDAINFSRIPSDALSQILMDKSLQVSVDEQICTILKWCGAEDGKQAPCGGMSEDVKSNLSYLGVLITKVDLTQASPFSIYKLMTNWYIQQDKDAVVVVNLQAANILEKYS
ncbi:hypothetical protein Btru_034134 [Bulinus truncatus]|nr:hypothetical protein Btru_034134 [Bulinus truncatus]